MVATIVAENPGCFFKGGTSCDVVNRMEHPDYSKAIRVYQVADGGENNTVKRFRDEGDIRAPPKKEPTFMITILVN